MAKDFNNYSICSYSQKDREIICFKFKHLLVIRIRNHYLVWDTEDLHCYRIDSTQFEDLRSMINNYCSTLEDFLIKVPSYSSFIKTALADDFLFKVFGSFEERLPMYYRIEYPVEDPSTTVTIYYHSRRYVEDYNNWYIKIKHKESTYYFEITFDNKISYAHPSCYVDFHSKCPEEQSIWYLPNEGRELLKSFIDSGAYKYILHQSIDINNYKPDLSLRKVIPEKNDETNLFG